MTLLQDISRYKANNFANAPTWADLLRQLQQLTPAQLSNPVTVELNFENECIPGNLDISGPNHDSLDEDIPVIRIDW